MDSEKSQEQRVKRSTGTPIIVERLLDTASERHAEQRTDKSAGKGGEKRDDKQMGTSRSSLHQSMYKWQFVTVAAIGEAVGTTSGNSNLFSSGINV